VNDSAAYPSGRAYISDDGLYRYSLDRQLVDDGEWTCTFVMLNPSTADAEQDDPTIRRCIRFAREWGYGRLKVVNLYALRATDPKQLWLADDPVGPENDHVLSLAFGGSDLTIAAWGVHAKLERVAEIMAWPIRPRLCLGVTKDGHPRHPLYVRADAEPRLLSDEEDEAWLRTW
jgi:hypothetical protein